MMRLPPLALAALAFVAAGASAQDRAEIDQTKIIGNRELPKVLYIVPWKKPLPGQLSGKPPASVLDEVLAPVDRDVFRRQVQYHAEVRYQAQVEAPKTAPATPSPSLPPVRP
jgi:hypothetical protein